MASLYHGTVVINGKMVPWHHVAMVPWVAWSHGRMIINKPSSIIDYGIILGSFWGLVGIMLGSCWGQLGVMVGSYWGQFGLNLGSCWVRFGVMLGSCWGHFGVLLGSSWGNFGVLLDHSGVYWGHDASF